MEFSMAVYKVGATVKLVSGGPVMTVKEVFDSIGDDTLYRCQWFAGVSRLSEGTFPEKGLEQADAKTSETKKR